jgi:hypothetical protein
MKKPFLVYCTLVLFSVYSLTGCAASNQVPVTSGPKAPASKIVTVSKDEVQRAALVSLQKLGYRVTDQRTRFRNHHSRAVLVITVRGGCHFIGKRVKQRIHRRIRSWYSGALVLHLRIDSMHDLCCGYRIPSSEEGKIKGHDNDQGRASLKQIIMMTDLSRSSSYKYVMTVRFTADVRYGSTGAAGHHADHDAERSTDRFACRGEQSPAE